MKQFFEQHGGVALGILALLVLIAMITPVGNIIKTSLQGTANKFSGSVHEQLDGAMNATASAQNSASGFEMNFSPNPGPETPVVPGAPEPTPNPEPETPIVPPVEPVTPENYNGYITEPGKYFVNLICENKDQKPDPNKIPMPYCLNYEMNVFVGKELEATSSEKVINYTSYENYNSPASKTENFTKNLGSWTGWIDVGKPILEKDGGDSEMVTFDITQEMLDEANGKIYLDWAGRGTLHTQYPLGELQSVGGRIGKIEPDGSQTILECRSFGETSVCS